MSTKSKQMILELVAGTFGWGWLIAGGFAVYYLVMAIGFDGSWISFVIALVVSGIAKWLARGFEDNKRRVAFEADMVAKGMSPEEAGKAWLEAYTDQGAPEVSAGGRPAVSMTDENRQKAEERVQIIADFGEFIENNPPAAEISDVKSLPHEKDAILSAICQEIIKTEDENMLEHLKVAALCLANFQEGVGDRPLSPYRDLTTTNPASLSDEDLMARVGQIFKNADTERFDSFQSLVEQNMSDIQARLLAAEQMRRNMPEEKKRELLG